MGRITASGFWQAGSATAVDQTFFENIAVSDVVVCASRDDHGRGDEHRVRLHAQSGTRALSIRRGPSASSPRSPSGGGKGRAIMIVRCDCPQECDRHGHGLRLHGAWGMHDRRPRRASLRSASMRGCNCSVPRPGHQGLDSGNSSSGYTALNTGTDLVAFTSRACRDSQWAKIAWNCAISDLDAARVSIAPRGRKHARPRIIGWQRCRWERTRRAEVERESDQYRGACCRGDAREQRSPSNGDRPWRLGSNDRGTYSLALRAFRKCGSVSHRESQCPLRQFFP